jgi:hypothetical protein
MLWLCDRSAVTGINCYSRSSGRELLAVIPTAPDGFRVARSNDQTQNPDLETGQHLA